MVTPEVHVFHGKLLGFEEISSSTCVQYILKLPESNSEESYDPIFTQTRFGKREKKRYISAADGTFKAQLIIYNPAR